MGLQLRLLGWMDVLVDGAALPAIGRRKARALLAYTALARRRTVTRDALAALLWGDRSEASARASLRQTLFLLRQQIHAGDASILDADGETVSLRETETDVEAFERLCAGDSPSDLEEAAALYRGEFLDDLTVSEEPFEQWQLAERMRLHRLVADTLERLASLRLGAGDAPAAIDTARRLLTLDPVREPAHRVLMRALAQSDQRSAALEHYQLCQRALAEGLGVKPEPETRRLFEEIRTSDPAGRSADPNPSRIVSEEPSSVGRDGARARLERRQVTVMRCDLLGPAALSAELEAERYRELLLPRQAAAVLAVQRFGGHVARHLGDGLLAYFGYPRAHEDAAERAVRAGLAILDALPEGPDQHVRIGIATGVVVAADAFDEEAGEEVVLGNAGRRAEQLQTESAARTVTLSGTTAELVSELFELEATGPPGPSRGWRVVSAIPRHSRFAGRAARLLSPFVGREEELARLKGRWDRARTGRGQVELIVGEAGIGKSRLTHEFLRVLGVEPTEVISLQCSAHHEDSALHPWVAFLRHTVRFAELTDPRRRSRELERHLEGIGDSDGQTRGLLAHLLSVPTDGRFPAMETMDAAERRERTLRVLVEYVGRRAASAPVLCIIEDVHWTDPSTGEFLNRLIDGLEDEPILVLATSRPGFQPGWADSPRAITTSLTRLGREEAGRLARAVASTRTGLSDEVLDTVLSRAEGNPLFVEELTLAVLEVVSDGPDGPARPTGAGRAARIPLTLRDSLLERLDRLGEAKPFAQVGAVIGREFTSELASTALGRDVEWTRLQLDKLVAARLVNRRGSPPWVHYVFKHALLQDAAYDSLLDAERKQLHAAIVDALDAEYAGSTEPGVLARHCLGAGLFARAVDLSIEAAEKCVGSSSLSEARLHYWRALGILDDHPEIADAVERKIRVAIALAQSSRWAATPRHVAALERAVESAESCRHDALLSEGCFWLARMYSGVGRRTDSMVSIGRCRDVAQRSGNLRLVAMAESTIVGWRYVTGDIAPSADEFPAIAEKLERVGELSQLAAVRSAIGNFLGWLGRFEDGLGWTRQTMAWAEETGNKSLQAASCLHLTMLHGTRGELAEALVHSERGIELAEAVGDGFTSSITRMLKGYYLYVLGGEPEGIALQLDSIARHELGGSQAMLGLHCAQLAECFALDGDRRRAEEFAERSLERVQAGETVGLSNAYLALALAARSVAPDRSLATDWFERAESVAQARGERPLLGKIYFHRARLQRGIGSPDEARALSAQAEALFEEMQMLWWVSATRELQA